MSNDTIELILISDGAAWLRQVATAEGLNGKPLEAYVQLFRECHLNLRECLARIGRGEMLK